MDSYKIIQVVFTPINSETNGSRKINLRKLEINQEYLQKPKMKRKGGKFGKVQYC